MNAMNKITIKSNWQITGANMTHQVTEGTQITPTPGGESIGAILNAWFATDEQDASVDIVIGSTAVGTNLVPNYRAEETPTSPTPAASTILDFAGVKINEDQIIADQEIGPSTPISVTLKSNAATSGRIHYLIVMEPVYTTGPASA